MVIAARPIWVAGGTTEALGSNPADMDTTYEFRYRVANLSDVITSHDDAYQPNPNYPQELQPRIRDRAASRTQIGTMAKNLNPRALLHDSGFIDTGPMIVGPDMVVESGNGRVMALRMAADDYPDRFALYRDILIKNASRYGLTPQAIEQFERPVLVRERLSQVDRVKFAAEANVGAVMGMSPFEQALQDSRRLSDHIVSTMEVGEEQSIDQALQARANAHIIKHFVSTVPASERAGISEAKGGINQQGLSRLKLAIFAKTYTGDAGQRLVRVFGENVDPVIKNMENAMFQSLPDMAKAESLIGAGQREPELSLATDLAEVMDTLASLKQSSITVKDFLAQSALFEERLDPFQKRLLEHIDDISRKPKRVRELIRSVADRIVEAPPPGQQSMLGFETATKGEIVNAIIERQREEYKLPALSTPPSTAASTRLEKSDAGGITEAGGLGDEMGRGITPPGIFDEPRHDTLAPRTSVQTGLSGFGKEDAQSSMLAEFATAPGAGGRKDTLIDVEDIKVAEAAKPLPGQARLTQESKRQVKASPKRQPASEKPARRKAMAQPKETSKKPTKEELLEIQGGRSARSIGTDAARLHSKVVRSDNIDVVQWAQDQGSMDVQGIDTPRKSKKKTSKKSSRGKRQSGTGTTIQGLKS